MDEAVKEIRDLLVAGNFILKSDIEAVIRIIKKVAKDGTVPKESTQTGGSGTTFTSTKKGGS